MKIVTSLFGILTGATLITETAQAEFKLLSFLRGEAIEPPVQRVAFVGCATVREVQGTAERLCGIDCWSAVKPGMELKPGDVIRAGTGTVVLKIERSDSYVKINSNTVLRLVPEEVPASASRALASSAR